MRKVEELIEASDGKQRGWRIIFRKRKCREKFDS